MKYIVTFIIAAVASSGSNTSPQLQSPTKCPFNIPAVNGACPSPDTITVLPPLKELILPQTFPNKNVLTVVSNTSDMVGDIKCDGINDELDIQQAIDNMVTTGGTVILSDGIFHMSNQLILCSNLVLRGQGMNITILFIANNAINYLKAGNIRGYGISSFILQDFQINGNRLHHIGDAYQAEPVYGKFGLFCGACFDGLFLRVSAVSNTGYGFDPHGIGRTMVMSKNLTFRNCWAYDNNWDGFAIDKVENGLVQDCWSTNNGRHGFNIITGSTNIIVKNNFAYDNGYFYMKGTHGNGIVVQSNTGLRDDYLYITNSVIVENNTIGGSRRSGIYVKSTKDISIIKNKIDSIGYCITVLSTTNTIIKYNSCIKNIEIKNNNNTNIREDISDTAVSADTKDKSSAYGMSTYIWIITLLI